MKRHVTLFLLLLFVFAFSFTLTQALSDDLIGPPPPPPSCCRIPATASHSEGWGVRLKNSHTCTCAPMSNPDNCLLVCPIVY